MHLYYVANATHLRRRVSLYLHSERKPLGLRFFVPRMKKDKSYRKETAFMIK